MIWSYLRMMVVVMLEADILGMLRSRAFFFSDALVGMMNSSRR